MLECFLGQDNNLVMDRDNNTIYLTRQLRKIVIDIKDSESKKVTLRHLFAHMPDALVEQWDTQEWYSVMSGAAQVAFGIPLSPPIIGGFNAGFGFGLLMERLRQKKGLIINVNTEEISSREVDSILAQFRDTPPEPDVEGDDESAD